MLDFLRTSAAQAVIWVTVLSVLLVVAYYVLQKFRDRTGDDRESANELMTNFREMHHEGDISDAEFRTIKTVLGPRIRSELKDKGDTG